MAKIGRKGETIDQQFPTVLRDEFKKKKKSIFFEMWLRHHRMHIIAM